MQLSYEANGKNNVLTLGELSRFVAQAYSEGGTDESAVGVETNVTIMPGRTGIHRIWLKEDK